MNKIWYVEIEGKLEGPYSIRDLRCDIRVTPDTLAWKKGFAKPIPIRNIPELKALFEDSEESGEEESGPKKTLDGFGPIQGDQEMVLEMGMDPFKWWLLLLLVFLVLFFGYVLS